MQGELKDRAAQAVEMAQDAGAEEAWVSTSRNRDVEFEYRDGALEKVKDTTSQRMSVQIFRRREVLDSQHDGPRRVALTWLHRRGGRHYTRFGAG